MTMTRRADSFTITIRKRPSWFWALAAVWVLAEVLFLQTAFASASEGEYRAAAISWGAVAVLVLIGAFAWFRAGRSHKLEAGEQH